MPMNYPEYLTRSWLTKRSAKRSPGLSTDKINYGEPWYTGDPREFTTRLLFPVRDERRHVEKKDLAGFNRILGHMRAARPDELATTAVTAGTIEDPELVSNRVLDQEYKDSLLDRMLFTRARADSTYARTPPELWDVMPDSYHPLPDMVHMQHRSPAVLIHELGHAIDYQRNVEKDKFLKSLRWRLKPTLLQERDAWNKGLDAYTSGYGSSKDLGKAKRDAEYTDALISSYGTRRPALGSYLGGGLGTVGGAVGGALLARYLRESHGFGGMRSQIALPLGGALIGGGLGTLTGLTTGRLLSTILRDRDKKRALQSLEELKQAKKNEKQK